MLTAEQKRRSDQLLDALLDLPASDRLAELVRLCSDDPKVYQEVRSLLEADSEAGEFLSKPAAAARSGLESSDPYEQLVGIGMNLGRWRITRRIGTGGMGDVFEAQRASGDFEQRVALKLLRTNGNRDTERFQAERQILARLEHPGIARLLDGGIASDGRPYMVMEFVHGRPITEYCRDVGASLEGRLALFMQVCDAVSHAHRSLLVHRDLKPANILVTDDGQVKLLDFGIAKFLDDRHSELSGTAGTPLTPSCAAPEQLTGGAITTATDVYALGLLLFELLAGSHPRADTKVSAAQLMRSALQEVPALSSWAARGGPIPARRLEGDLDAIAAKALRVEPSHRYASVDALRLDVEHHLRGHNVGAREGARFYLVRRLLWRYRWAVAGISVVILTLSATATAALWQARRAVLERDIAQRSAAREEALRTSLTHLFGSAIAERGGMPVSAKNVIDASANRVLEEYRDEPNLAGPLVLSLADLYGSLEDVEGRGKLLEGFVAQFGPSAEPADLADARQKLAEIELQRGHLEQAGSLLDQAEVFWSGMPQKFQEEHLEGLAIRVKAQHAAGKLDQAIATAGDAITQRIAFSGRNHRETANLYNSLALALVAGRKYDQALIAYGETNDIYRAIGKGDSLEALVVRANTGILQMRLGHLRDAEMLLKDSAERQRALGGDSAAVAAALGVYGKVLAVTNRNAAAITTLRDAAAMAIRYAGSTSPVALQDQIFLADAQVTNGNLADAETTLNIALMAARSQFKPSHPLILRLQSVEARLELARGHRTAAQDMLNRTIEGFHNLGEAGVAYLAEALEVRGDLELADGNAEVAASTFGEELTLREGTHIQSWELHEAQERLGETLLSIGQAARARALLVQAEAGLKKEFSADHPEVVRAVRALGRPSM
jgi:hypothetical protein